MGQGGDQVKIMLTGAGGFVGRRVERELVAAGHGVLALPGRREGFVDLRYAPPPKDDVEAVIHLAADSGVADSLDLPRRCIENNLGALMTILDWVRARPGTRLVHLSTDEAQDPRNPYAASKAAQEAVIAAYRATYGILATVVRADLIVGAGQPAHKAVPAMTRAILEGRPVPIFCGPAGVGVRRWRGVGAAASGLRFLAELQDAPERVHLGGVRLTNSEVADAIADLLGRSWEPELVERPDVTSGVRAQGPDVQDLGWRPPNLFAAELERAVRAVVAMIPA